MKKIILFVLVVFTFWTFAPNNCRTHFTSQQEDKMN